jgi:hypothetical protein
MAGAGEGFFPPISQLLFSPTDNAFADSKALLHLDCVTALFRSHVDGLQPQLSIELPYHIKYLLRQNPIGAWRNPQKPRNSAQ